MKSFNQVLDRVYIGSLFAMSEQEALREAGITSVLKLTHSSIGVEDGFTVMELPFPDGWLIPDGYLRRGLDFVRDQEAQGNSVLIMCAAGISRSAAFTLGYLVERGYDLHEAFEHLRTCRPAISPHPSLWISLLEFFGEPYSLNDVLSWR
jgi:predicted protein tyrosine phosphatase